jgi:hypothetical protein
LLGSTLSAFGLPDAAISVGGCDELSTQDVFLLPVAEAVKSGFGSKIEGLILEQTPRGTYRRLGIFGDLQLQQPPSATAGPVERCPSEEELMSWFPQETIRIE